MNYNINIINNHVTELRKLAEIKRQALYIVDNEIQIVTWLCTARNKKEVEQYRTAITILYNHYMKSDNEPLAQNLKALLKEKSFLFKD